MPVPNKLVLVRDPNTKPPAPFTDAEICVMEELKHGGPAYTAVGLAERINLALSTDTWGQPTRLVSVPFMTPAEVTEALLSLFGRMYVTRSGQTWDLTVTGEKAEY